MSDGTRIPRDEVLPLAEELVVLLSPYCERLEIVGSLRRLKPDVGDIELLAIPKTDMDMQRDLFGAPVAPPLDLLHIEVDELALAGVLFKRTDATGHHRWGQRFKAVVYQGFPVDLFVCKAPAQWGVLSIIRTGSADFSHRLVTPVEQGGWMPQGMYCRNGALWCATQGAAFETPDETDVFVALGREYIPPEQREVQP